VNGKEREKIRNELKLFIQMVAYHQPAAAVIGHSEEILKKQLHRPLNYFIETANERGMKSVEFQLQ
jgi:hypothetical protein